MSGADEQGALSPLGGTQDWSFLTSRAQSPVVLFMKGDVNVPRCGFSQKIVKLLKENEVEFTTHDILQDEAARQRASAFPL